MPKKTAVPVPHELRNNIIWIELSQPPKEIKDQAERQAFREKQCELANRMLRRLQSDPETKVGSENGMHFWVSSSERSYGRYNLTTSGAGTYTELADNGYHFNLDWLGREPDEASQIGKPTYADLLQLLGEVERLGLDFAPGNAYIRTAYVEQQTALCARIAEARKYL